MLFLGQKVIKRDGRKVNFDRQKIFNAIYKALEDSRQYISELKNINADNNSSCESCDIKTCDAKTDKSCVCGTSGNICENKNMSVDDFNDTDNLDTSIESTADISQNTADYINKLCERLTCATENRVKEEFIDKNKTATVENIQDIVEQVLMDNKLNIVAKNYILYRFQRTQAREAKTEFMQTLRDLTYVDSSENETKRENANIDGNTAMGTMLKYGSEGAKYFYEICVLPKKQSKAHHNGDIHIHDLDFYTLTTTCCQIDLLKLFKDGFSTGHGFLREPQSIRSYSALACIAIQSNQNDQHGGQSIPNFDYVMAEGLKKTFKQIYISNLFKAIELVCPEISLNINQVKDLFKDISCDLDLSFSDKYISQERKVLSGLDINSEKINLIQTFVHKTVLKETEREVYQAMEALIHNLNTMHSRAGAQVPFSSINYGTDTSLEGRMVIKNLLLATEQGLGKHETAIFPIQIFKVKEGVNYNQGDKNYDLFKLACRVSAKRLFPNFAFIDAPFNIKYYRPNHPETEIVYMGCRTRVIGNLCGPEIVYGRGNLSFTSINLPRIALKIMSKKNISDKEKLDLFFKDLESKLKLVTEQLRDRFEIQCNKKVKNFPFLMGQGVWIDSDKLKPDDKIKDVLKHGTLSVGFIGLAETLVALTGKHQGESPESQKLGLKIIKFMRDYLDKLSQKEKLNYSLLATPAEGLSGRFVRLDKKKFGIIKGVTDRDYYTNSFHVPVYYKISAYDKIRIEAPYHELTNAGHITYVELDGDSSNNLEAFEKIIRAMKESGIGYGSVNHPVDRDPVCGYNGIIENECPKCGRKETCDHKFERIRRITGYLVGTLDRFNDAKKSEEKERVKHNTKM